MNTWIVGIALMKHHYLIRKIFTELFTDLLELITGIIQVLITGGVCRVICRYAEANNKYMNNYDENKESSFLSYLDANNLYGCPMIEKLPVSSFKWVKNVSRIDQEFIKNYDENSDIGYFLKADLEYHKELHDFHNDLPFLPQKMEINKHDKLVCALYDKKRFVVHIKKHKTSIKSWLKTKKSL